MKTVSKNRKNKFLIVDNNKDNLSSLRLLLDGLFKDCEIISSLNGAEALGILESYHPHVTLLDIHMPVMNGYELCGKIKNNKSLPYISVLFLTGEKLSLTSKIKGYDAGGDDYIMKPVDRDELHARINNALKLKSLNDDLLKERDSLTIKVQENTKAFKESEVYYRVISQLSPVGIFRTDINGKCIYANEQWCKIAGFSSKQALGTGWEKAIDPADRERVYNEWYTSTQEQRPFKLEYRIRRPDGSVIWVLGQSTVETDVNGKPSSFIGTITDITEMKKLEVELKTRTHDLGERIKELDCLYNIAKLFSQPGISFEKMFGNILNLIPLGWRYPDITFAKIVYEGKEFKKDNFKISPWKQSAEIKVYGETAGEIAVFYAEERPEIDEGPFLKEERNLINNIAKQLGDMIESEKATEDLKLFRVLINRLNDSIFIINPETGGFLDINDKACSSTGYSREELITMKVIDIEAVIPDNFSWDAHVAEVKKKGYMVLEGSTKHKNGAVFPTEINVKYIVQGEKAFMLAVVRDITERKNTEKEIRLLYDELGRFNKELEKRVEERTGELKQVQSQLFQTSKLATLGEMATGLAHEINQPLGAISLVAQIFRKLIQKEKLSQEEIESGLADIEHSVTRMSKIIQHIRTFARQETLEFTQVDVNETLVSALSLLGERLKLHEVEVIREFSGALPEITGDPYQLEQVWINLISNAYDALEKAGEMRKGNKEKYQKKISISTNMNESESKKSVVICVRDNGAGMSTKQKEKAFEPFFTTKEVGKGTGLGLSISYGIIKSHNGRIKLESTEGQGTAITVILPV